VMGMMLRLTQIHVTRRYKKSVLKSIKIESQEAFLESK
jgi:hypothetical protein